MTDLVLNKTIQSLIDGKLDKEDKIFVLRHCLETMRSVGEACVIIPLARSDALSTETGSSTCGRARKRECDLIVEEMTSSIETIETQLLDAMNRHREPDPVTTIKDTVIWSKSPYGNGVCVDLYSDDVIKIEKFKYLCLTNIPRDMMAFHQINQEGHQMFDIWYPKFEQLAFLFDLICTDVQLKIINNLDIVPDFIRSVNMSIPYTPFNDDLHTFNDFHG